MNKFFFALYLFLIVVVCLCCEKDKPQINTTQSSITSEGVFIINEGNFTWGNSSVSYYNTKTNEVIEDVYKSNNSLPLGDVAQSAVKIGENYFIVVNNSKKIEIVNALSFKKIKTIEGFRSPRYCIQTGVSKLYVSDLYDNHISIVNLVSGEISGKIYCKGWTEQMLIYKNKVFVTNLYSKYLYVINSTTDALEDSIDIGFASNSICMDNLNKIWVACSGKKPDQIKSAIHKINPETKTIEQTFTVENTATNITINGTKDTLYFLNKGIFQFEKSSNSLPSTPIVAEENKLFYGLGVMPTLGDIFVSDALDYVQQGNVYRYTNKGEKKFEFKTGIIPNGFLFQ